jgi:hypothetical protein
MSRLWLRGPGRRHSGSCFNPRTTLGPITLCDFGTARRLFVPSKLSAGGEDALDPDRLMLKKIVDPREQGLRQVWPTLLILLTFAVSQGFIHYQYCVPPNLDEHFVSHNHVIAGDSLSPYRYRLLAPYTAELMIKGFSVLFVYERALKFAYALWCMLAMSTTVVGSWLYFRLWFSGGLATSGALLVGSSILTIMLTKESYQNHWSLIEPGFWALGFWCIAQDRKGLLALVIILATANRETGCFIVLAYILSNTDIFRARPDSTIRSKRKWLVGYVCCYLLTYSLIRAWQGNVELAVPVGQILSLNLTDHSWAYFLRKLGLALSFFWVLVVLGAKYAPKQVLMACRVIPFYLAAVFIFGIWQEVRLLTPTFPLLVAVGLSFVERRT